MIDLPETPDVFQGDAPDVMGAASLVLWTALARQLVEKGVLSVEEVQATIATAHKEFATEYPASDRIAEGAMALLARLSMNAV